MESIYFWQPLKADRIHSDELNEEDAQLKSELEMLVERLQVSSRQCSSGLVQEMLNLACRSPIQLFTSLLSMP